MICPFTEGVNSGRNSIRWLIFAFLTVIVSLPNLLPWERGAYPTTYLIDLQERVFLAVPLSVLGLTVFRSWHRSWAVLWVLFLWWMPISLAVRWINGTAITASLVGIALESTPNELTELSYVLAPTVLAGFLCFNLLCFAVFLYLRRHSELHWFSNSSRLLAASPGLLIAVSGIWPQVTGLNESLEEKNGAALSFDEHRLPGSISSRWALMYPQELYWAWKEHAANAETVATTVSKMSEPARKLPGVQAHRMIDVVVLVIGESSSREDWSLFNPRAVDTNPLLQSRAVRDEGLFLQKNLVSMSTATRYSVPSMLTDQPLYWPDGSANPKATRSIVYQAAQQGYRTGWYSNQTAGGRFDGPVAVYAREASVVAFLNPAGYLQRGTYDEVLLPSLAKHLKESDKAFIVLHTLGSHFKFSYRYPDKFDRYKPLSSGAPVANKESEVHEMELNKATYRNSILYTDSILDRIIAMLEADGRAIAMLYVSDHGQGLAEPGCNKEVVNRSMARAYEVPSMVWLSLSLRRQFPWIAEALKAAEHRPLTIDAVYPTLVELLSAQINKSGSSSKPSFLSGGADDLPQMVVSPQGKWVNFKRASDRNRCLISAE